MLSVVVLRLHPLPGNKKCCVSITLLNDRHCVHDFSIKALEYRNNFDTVEKGKVVCFCTDVHLSLCDGNWQHHKTPKSKNGKIWGFPPPKCKRINRSRWNSAYMHGLWVYSSIPNLDFISKGPGAGAPPLMSTFSQNCSFLSMECDTIAHMDSNEIWHVSIDHGFTVSCQIRPRLVKRDGHKSPSKMLKFWSNLQYFDVFLSHMGDTLHQSRTN